MQAWLAAPCLAALPCPLPCRHCPGLQHAAALFTPMLPTLPALTSAARPSCCAVQGSDGYMYCDGLKIDDIRAQVGAVCVCVCACEPVCGSACAVCGQERGLGSRRAAACLQHTTIARLPTNATGAHLSLLPLLQGADRVRGVVHGLPVCVWVCWGRCVEVACSDRSSGRNQAAAWPHGRIPPQPLRPLIPFLNRHPHPYTHTCRSANYRAYQEALAGLDSIIGYAVKANNNFRIMQVSCRACCVRCDPAVSHLLLGLHRRRRCV